MALTRPYPVDKAFPNAADVRRGQAAVFPREGVFPDPVTILAAGIAYAGSGWNVGARAFTANVKRGGAPFSLAYGAAQVANDAALATAWTLPGAPSSGSWTSLLWVRATDPTQGETTTQVSGETDPAGTPRPRAVPTFGITTGTTSTAPVLPAGAELIASVVTPSTATSAAGAVITQAYDFAGVNGGIQYARTEAKRDASSPLEGEVWYCLDTQRSHQRISGAWVHFGGKPEVGIWTPQGIYVANDSSRPVRAFLNAGRVYVEGNIASNISANFVSGEEYAMGKFADAFGIRVVRNFWVDNNATRMLVRVYPDGTISFRPTSSFTGVLNLSLDGLSWTDKKIAP